MDTEFAYWVPNVSGGLVVSDWETETDWTYDYNLDLARTAESVGFDYALAQARFFGSYGADKQLEALSIANALAAQTDELHVIGAVHPGLWEPGPLANFIATSDRISNGRFSINIVSGWFKGEFTGFGQPWLEHDERYARSSEFIEVLKALWTEERATYDGRFYTIGKDIEGFEGAPLEPKPVQDPYPQVFQGGNSQAAREMAAKHSDVLFINGGSLQEIRAVIDDVEEYAEEFGTEPPRFAANAFVIQRDTESEAKEVLEGIIENATDEAVDAFKDQVKEAGQSSGEGEGCGPTPTSRTSCNTTTASRPDSSGPTTRSSSGSGSWMRSASTSSSRASSTSRRSSNASVRRSSRRSTRPTPSTPTRSTRSTRSRKSAARRWPDR